MANDIIALFSFAGFLIGMFIASKTKEELKPGRKYFKTARRVLLLVTGLFILNYIEVDAWLLLAGGVLGYFMRKQLAYFGAALGAAATAKLANITAAFTFIYGMVEGTLEFEKGNKKAIIIVVLIFFIAYFALRFIGLEALANIPAGAMIVEALRKK